MDEKPSAVQARLKRRWTLGGLMILIAVLAVPMAFYVQHAREVERQEAARRDLIEKLRAEMNKLLDQMTAEKRPQ